MCVINYRMTSIPCWSSRHSSSLDPVRSFTVLCYFFYLPKTLSSFLCSFSVVKMDKPRATVIVSKPDASGSASGSSKTYSYDSVFDARFVLLSLQNAATLCDLSVGNTPLCHSEYLFASSIRFDSLAAYLKSISWLTLVAVTLVESDFRQCSRAYLTCWRKKKSMFHISQIWKTKTDVGKTAAVRPKTSGIRKVVLQLSK